MHQPTSPNKLILRLQRRGWGVFGTITHVINNDWHSYIFKIPKTILTIIIQLIADYALHAAIIMRRYFN